MAHRLSRKRVRDAATIESWRRYGEEVFRKAGIPREAVAGTLPGDKCYDHLRKLFNPLFQSLPSAIVMCETEID
jgi:hypothetical protein